MERLHAAPGVPSGHRNLKGDNGTVPYNDDDFEGEEQNPVKVLREANKALKKDLDEAREAMAKLSAQARTSTVRDALADLKVDPKIAKLFPSDKDATPENVKEWVEEYADVFGAKAPAQDQPPVQEPLGGEPNLDTATREAWLRTQAQEHSSGAVPADIEQQQLAALQAMSAFAGDDPDKYKALLRGEMKLPTA